jgi:hypothetical protein
MNAKPEPYKWQHTVNKRGDYDPYGVNPAVHHRPIGSVPWAKDPADHAEWLAARPPRKAEAGR